MTSVCSNPCTCQMTERDYLDRIDELIKMLDDERSKLSCLKNFFDINYEDEKEFEKAWLKYNE